MLINKKDGEKYKENDPEAAQWLILEMVGAISLPYEVWGSKEPEEIKASWEKKYDEALSVDDFDDCPELGQQLFGFGWNLGNVDRRLDRGPLNNNQKRLRAISMGRVQGALQTIAAITNGDVEMVTKAGFWVLRGFRAGRMDEPIDEGEYHFTP